MAAGLASTTFRVAASTIRIASAAIWNNTL